MLPPHQCETELRRHTTKIRAGFRGLIELMHKNWGGSVEVELIEFSESLIMAQLETAIAELTEAIQGRSD